MGPSRPTGQLGRFPLLCSLVLTAFLGTSALAFDLGGTVDQARNAATTATAGGGDQPKASDQGGAKPKPSTLPPFTGPKKRLGVMDMEVKITTSAATQPTQTGGTTTTTTTTQIPPPTDFGTGLTEMLTTALIDSGRFILLERKALTDIQAEQTLGTGGTVDPASAAKPGSLLGAQALIRGAVTEFNYCSSSTGGSAQLLGGLGLQKSSAEATVVLDIRIYDANTSQILDSVKAEGHAKSSSTSVNVQVGDWQMGGSNFSQTPLGQATRQAIQQAVLAICKRMDTMPWEGCIAEMDTDDAGVVSLVYVNGGTDTGFKVGDNLEVFRAGRTIVDPETRTVIGRTKDTCIGHIHIDEVNAKLSTASVVDGQGFKIGDLLKFLAPGQKPLTPTTPRPEAAAPADQGAAAPAVQPAPAPAVQPPPAGGAQPAPQPAPQQ